MYKNLGGIIPQSKREDINKKILYLIENNLCNKYNVNHEDIFNSYTGDGGLHGLEFTNYNSFHAYTEAKKEQEQGQFFTPHHLSKFLVDCLKHQKQDMVADLTCGMGNFFNYLPTQENVYGNELDIKAYKVAKHLYPNANITNQDIRYFNTDVQFDIVLGNPPFNLKWTYKDGEYSSQLVYCMKAYELLKQGGMMALIVPSSFLKDDFIDSGVIKKIDNMFNFIFQADLPKNSFKNVGVDVFETKIMIFQKKGSHLTDKPYSIQYREEVTDTDNDSKRLYKTYVEPIISDRDKIKNQLMLENAQKGQEERDFQYRVKKLLFDIKRNKKLKKYHEKSEQYVTRYYTQRKPDDMEYDQWLKVRLTKNKVISYLKTALKKQHENEQDKIELVKTRYGLKLKPYSRKKQIQLSKEYKHKPTSLTFNEMIEKGIYPFENKKYAQLVEKKRKEYKRQELDFSDVEPGEDVKKFLESFELVDTDNNEVIKPNEIQKIDSGKMLEKNYGYLQWDTGAGKSISGIAQMVYRLKNKQVRNVYLVAPAIAINNNWDDILKSYKKDYIRINKLSDITNIKQGQIVIMTYNMLVKYKRFIKKDVKMKNNKVMFVLDEADGIANPSSKRTKAVLDCFRRVKYKLLMSATSTRNNIPESFTAFEMLYNNSINMTCHADTIYMEDRKTKELVNKPNELYKKPFPAYRKGHTLFKRAFSPEKASVFAVGKMNQDIYNKDILKQLIDKTMITRTFEEVSGKDIYKIVQNTCKFNYHEKALYKIIVDEFYKLSHLFRSTGNTRKDAMLKIMHQLNSLLKACVTPNDFSDYGTTKTPTKAIETINKLNTWENEIAVIGCTHLKTVETYKRYIQEQFPNRPLFVITGEISLSRRKEIVQELKETTNGILLCTQQSLSSSMNIDFVNRVLIIEMMWNFAAHKQFFARFIRYTSKQQKEIHFLTAENTIESNLLKLIMDKERLNSFMKNDDVEESEVMDRFGVDYDILNMLLTKETDEDGNSYINWGNQKVV